MLKYENRCCDCSTDGYRCNSLSCSLRKFPVYYCDFCGTEIDKGFQIEDKHYCDDCARGYFTEIFEELKTEEQADALDIEYYRLE